MKKNLLLLLLTITGCQLIFANAVTENFNQTELVNKYADLQKKQIRTDNEINELSTQLEALSKKNELQESTIDSLQNVCKQLDSIQATDRGIINGKLTATDKNILNNSIKLHKSTIWGLAIAIIIIIVIVAVCYWILRRINSGNNSIDEVRNAQKALQSAQTKMQEESIKLDNKLLELAEKQLGSIAPTNVDNEVDHSLALKVADEIVRIELNLSHMDNSIRGYKQLAKAVQRIKDNFIANGYEIVDILGKPFNEGMKVSATFITDEEIEEGKQIITGITKPQINYNGSMIQTAEITVSQNI